METLAIVCTVIFEVAVFVVEVMLLRRKPIDLAPLLARFDGADKASAARLVSRRAR